MGKVHSGDGRIRCHREGLGQVHVDFVGAEQVKERLLFGVVGLGRIPGGGPYAGLALLDDVLDGQILILGIAPQASPHLTVSPLRERFGQAIS